jgi:hypothetical protein
MSMLHAGHDHPGPGPLLDAILGHWAICNHTRTQPAVCRAELQPNLLAHTRPVRCLVWTVPDAFYVP